MCCFFSVFSAHAGEKSIRLKEVSSLGEKRGSEFVQVGEIVTDSKSCIYVTDEYQYKVKKFDARGHSAGSYGTRGNKAGQFEAGPYKLNCTHDTLAIVGVGSHTVQFFTNDLTPIGEAPLAGVIVDFALTRQGLLYAATIQRPSQSDNTLVLYTKSGQIVAKLNTQDLAKDPILDMMCLCTDVNDYLIAAALFVNKVMIYSNRQALLAEFKVPVVPDQTIEKSDLKDLMSMPDNLFSDIQTDGNGNIFVLAGLRAQHPDRDVYVLDYHGHLKTVFQLPDETGVIHIDCGHLYTRERKRSIVKKYLIEYINF